MYPSRNARRGFTLVELLIVIAILSVVFLRVSSLVSEVRARSALRAARQELTAVFAAARATAMQKGRKATLTIVNSSASVTVASSIDGSTLTLLGPIVFSRTYGTQLTPVNSAPTTVTFDGRGLATPASPTINRYRLTNTKWADTVCISGSGIVLMRGCQL